MAPKLSQNPDESIYEEWDCPQVIAIYEFTSTQPDELSLCIGDVVNVLKKINDGKSMYKNRKLVCYFSFNVCVIFFTQFESHHFISFYFILFYFISFQLIIKKFLIHFRNRFCINLKNCFKFEHRESN